jgi:hypothetical protein
MAFGTHKKHAAQKSTSSELALGTIIDRKISLSRKRDVIFRARSTSF